MTSENLQRTSYRDPNTPDDRVRSGTPTLAENEQDMDQYYRPLERIHGSSLHGWGVASGLSVTATLNSATLTIQPGVALDSSGQHISLAVGGNAEVGQNPTGFSTGATFVPVTASGMAMPTSGLTGDKYLTIQFWETFDSDSYNNLGLFRYFHTPWVRLLDVAGFTNDGNRVVLAKVSFGTGATAGQVTALTQELRQATDLPVGSIHLQRNVQSTTAGNVVAATMEAGVLQAHATGGVDLTVPNATDEVHLERDDGTNFAKVSLGAEKIVARQGNGTESVIIDTEAGSLTTSGAIIGGSIATSGGVTAAGAITGGSISTSGGVTASGPITTSGNMEANGTITSGTSGSNGEVSVNDAKGNPTIVLNGGIATVEIGNADSYGVLNIRDTSGGWGCQISGSGEGTFSSASGKAVLLNKGAYAGLFGGNVEIRGTLTKSSGSFQIDHPLDPANKYLSHSFVESPDMKNIYDGVVVLDANGEAVVELPAWFEALNTDFRYQFSPIGVPGPNLYIAEKVRDNRFKIAGGTPGLEVSWQITGTRQDAWANAHRVQVEEDKPPEEQGYYLHPELYGAPSEKHLLV